MASCRDCGEAYASARRNLGYHTCLPCGDKEAAQLNPKRS